MATNLCMGVRAPLAKVSSTWALRSYFPFEWVRERLHSDSLVAAFPLSWVNIVLSHASYSNHVVVYKNVSLCIQDIELSAYSHV